VRQNIYTPSQYSNMLSAGQAIALAIGLVIVFQVAIPIVKDAIDSLNVTVYGINLGTFASLILLGLVLMFVFYVLRASGIV